MVMTKARNRRWEDMDKNSVELGDLAQHFELFNRTEGKSPKTISWYNLSLRQLQRFLLETERPTNLGELGEDEVREFIIFLQGKNRWQDNPYVPAQQTKLAAISVQTYVRALRAFFSWLYREGYTSENRLAKLRPPKAPTRVVDILTSDEISRILGCLDTDTWSGDPEEVNMESGYLKVMGKGGKERIVPFGASAQKALLRYLLHFRPEPFHVSVQNIFLSIDGKPLTENTVRMIFRRIAGKSGVKRLHPHLCRHTFATNYLINGGDVFSLQQILGHTTLEMVRRYVTIASAHVTVQHRKFSPMDRMSLTKANLSRSKAIALPAKFDSTRINGTIRLPAGAFQQARNENVP
jgi:site-specific recombinase XerD